MHLQGRRSIFLRNVGELLLYSIVYISEGENIHNYRSEILKCHILSYHSQEMSTAANSIMSTSQKLRRGVDRRKKVRNSMFTKCNT
jgi:hypothetical protein